MKRIRKIEGMQGTRIKKRKLRVAAYCRVSTDSDAQLESLDIVAQLSRQKSKIFIMN